MEAMGPRALVLASVLAVSSAAAQPASPPPTPPPAAQVAQTQQAAPMSTASATPTCDVLVKRITQPYKRQLDVYKKRAELDREDIARLEAELAKRKGDLARLEAAIAEREAIERKRIEDELRILSKTLR